MVRGVPLAVAGVLAAGVLASGQTPPARVRTVFVIAMENTNWTQPGGDVTGALQQIADNPAAPFLNGLVRGTLTTAVRGRTLSSQTAYATAYHQVMATPSGAGAPSIHPSEPNYIWSEAGTNLGVVSDRDPYGLFGTNQQTTAHLCALLGEAGKTWRSYQEDIDLQGDGSAKTDIMLPEARWTVPLAAIAGMSPAYTNPYNGSHQYNYAPKHNPPVFFSDTNGGDDATPGNAMARHYAPLQQLADGLGSGRDGRLQLDCARPVQRHALESDRRPFHLPWRDVHRRRRPHRAGRQFSQPDRAGDRLVRGLPAKRRHRHLVG